MKYLADSVLGYFLGLALIAFAIGCAIAVGNINADKAEVACYQAGGTWTRGADTPCDMPNAQN